MHPSLYEILEVSPNASAPVIKAAYRCLVQQVHPDRNPGDPACAERLALINQAYAVLADPLSRVKYDHKLKGKAERRGSGRAMPSAEPRGAMDVETVRPFGFRRFQ